MLAIFDCIGFHFENSSEFESQLVRLAESAEPARRDWGTLRVWRDSSGAQVVFSLNKRDEIECSKPSFDARSRVQARWLRFLSDSDCRYCDLTMCEIVDDAGVMCYPLALELEDVTAARQVLTQKPTPVTLAITAFAEETQVWDSAEAYATAGREATHNMAVQSLIPVGAFSGEEHPRSQVLFTGIVQDCVQLLNRESNREFVWASVKTFGMTVDMVTAKEVGRALQRGNVIQGTFWCIGQLIDPTPGRSASTRLGRFFGR